MFECPCPISAQYQFASAFPNQSIEKEVNEFDILGQVVVIQFGENGRYIKSHFNSVYALLLSLKS